MHLRGLFVSHYGKIQLAKRHKATYKKPLAQFLVSFVQTVLYAGNICE